MTTPAPDDTIVFNDSQASSTAADEPRIKLVLVDDDDDFREAASNELDYLGFDVIALNDGVELVATVQSNPDVEIIVLDWRLPSGLGIELLRPLREGGIHLPVIFLTAIPATAYESAALDGGAVDFVDKARGITILAKRIRSSVALSRRLPPGPAREEIRCGGLELRPETGAAMWNGTDPGLTVTEFNIVHLLASRAGEYVTYRSIYDCVHRIGFVAGDGSEGYRTNVRSTIKRIRNKFRAIEADFSEIENYAAFGYRWREPQHADESQPQE